MKALVTGGAGFIGSHLVEMLLEDGHEVIVIDSSKHNIDRNLSGTKAKVVENDINSLETHKYYEGVDWVVHLAALADIVPSIEEPETYHHTNVNGSLSVLEASRKANVRSFIYAASSSCYGDNPPVPTTESAPLDPKYPYALTKLIGEQYTMLWQKLYGLPANSLRFFNVYGPRSRTTGTYGAVFGVFLKQKLENKAYTVVGDGHQSRDFVFVTDVCEAIIKTLKSGVVGEVLNVGTQSHSTIKNLINILGGFKINYIPKRKGEPQITCAAIGKIQKVIGWQPRTQFKEGVKIMLDNIEYWREAPLWDVDSISKATESWHKYMGDQNVSRL